jgi:hypothetical protein
MDDVTRRRKGINMKSAERNIEYPPSSQED